MSECSLCGQDGGVVLWRSSQCHVVRVDDPHYPGYCRVIWNAHVREMTDLPADTQLLCMRIVLTVEAVVRELYSPHKINLASFGNMTPHLHWHIIPRWRQDRHFPEPIWGSPQREGELMAPTVSDQELITALNSALADLD